MSSPDYAIGARDKNTSPESFVENVIANELDRQSIERRFGSTVSDRACLTIDGRLSERAELDERQADAGIDICFSVPCLCLRDPYVRVESRVREVWSLWLRRIGCQGVSQRATCRDRSDGEHDSKCNPRTLCVLH